MSILSISKTQEQTVYPDNLVDKKSIIAAIKKDWKGVANTILKSNFKKDKDIVLCIVEQSGPMWTRIPEEMKEDEEIALAAIQQNYRVARMIFRSNSKFKNNYNIGLAAVEKDGLYLSHLSQELQNNTHIVLTAINQNGYALKYASDTLRNNRDIVGSAVHKDGLALEYASDALKNDRDIVNIALRQNPLAIVHVADSLADEIRGWRRLAPPKTFLIEIQDISHDPKKTLVDFGRHIQRHTLPKIKYNHSDAIDLSGVSKDFISRLFLAFHQPHFPTQTAEIGEKLLPKCNKKDSDELEMYLTIGKIFGAAFLNYREITTGSHFSDVIFQMIHSLNKEEIETISDDLKSDIPKKIIDKLLSLRLKSLPNMTKEDVQKILTDEFDELLEDTYAVDSKESFIHEYFDPILYGTIAIAKGMYAFLGESDWDKIKNQSPQDLQNKIEGSLSKQQILDAIIWRYQPHSHPQKNTMTQRHLIKWINETVESQPKQLEDFVFCLTGSKTLSNNTKLKVYMYDESQKLPLWHTCFNMLDMPNSYENYEMFKNKLETSLEHGKAGFQMT